MLENLENRALMTVTITEFPLPSNPGYNEDIISGPNNHLWITEGSQPSGIPSKIAEMTTDGKVVNEFNLSLNGDPIFGAGMATGSDGNLWFAPNGPPTDPATTGTKYGVGVITAVSTPTVPAGKETTYTTLGSRATYAITAGSDGNLWFIDTGGYIGKAIPGVGVTEIALGDFDTRDTIVRDDYEPGVIISGPDGNIWFREDGTLLKVDLNNNDTITPIPLPAGYGIGTLIDGHDSNIWFRGGTTDSLVTKYDPSTGVFTPYVPANNPPKTGVGFVRTPDGDFWFTDAAGQAIGQFDPTTKAIVDYTVPSGNEPTYLSIGPDGNLWFTEAASGRIGKVDLSAAAPTADLAIAATVTPGPYQFGSPLTYTLTVTNNGPSAAQTILATAVLPDNVAFAGAQGGTTGLSYNDVTGTVTFSLDSLASGASVDVPIQVYSTALGTHDSKILVASPATYQAPIFLVRDAVTDPTPTNNYGLLPAVDVVPATADLSIVAGTVPASVNVNGTLIYTLTLVNAGPSGAEDVVVTDQLPPGVVYTGPIDPTTALAGYAYQADQRIVTYHSFSLPPSPEDGSSVLISIPVKILAGAAGTTLSNSASVGNAITDSNLGNNTAVFTSVSVANSSVATADVSVTASTPENLIQGIGDAHVSTVLTIRNAGPATATNVVVRIEVPAGLNYIGAVGPTAPGDAMTYANHVFTYTRASLAVTGDNPVTFALPFAATAFGQMPAFSVSIRSSTPDGNAANNRAPIPAINVIAAPQITLNLDRSASRVTVDDQLTYTLTITNAAGAGAAHNLTVGYSLPIGFKFLSADPPYNGTTGLYEKDQVQDGVTTQMIFGRLDTLDPGTSFTVKITVIVGSDAGPGDKESTATVQVNGTQTLKSIKTTSTSPVPVHTVDFVHPSKKLSKAAAAAASKVLKAAKAGISRVVPQTITALGIVAKLQKTTLNTLTAEASSTIVTGQATVVYTYKLAKKSHTITAKLTFHAGYKASVERDVSVDLGTYNAYLASNPAALALVQKSVVGFLQANKAQILKALS